MTMTHDHKVRVGRGAVMQLSATAVQVMAGLAVSILLTRQVGFAAFGVYSLGFGAAIMLSLGSRFGMDVSVVKITAAMGPDQRRDASATIWSAMSVSAALGVVVGLALAVLSSPIAHLFGERALAGALRNFAVAVPFLNILYVSAGCMRARHRAGAWAGLIMLMYPLGRLGLVAVALHMKPDVEMAVLSSVVATAIAAFAGLILVLREFPVAGLASLPLLELLRFGSWQTMVASAQKGMQWADLLLVMAFLPVSAVGLYRTGAQTALLFSLVLSGLSLLFGPLASRMLALGQTEHLEDVAKSLARISLFVTGGAAALLLIEPSLVLWLFGSEADAAAPVYRAIGAAWVLTSALGPYAHVLVMGGRIKLEFVATASGLAVAVLGALVLIPPLGLAGAGLATGAGILLRTGLQLCFVHLRIGLTPISARWLRGFGALAALTLLAIMGPVPTIPAASFVALLFTGWSALFVLTPADRDVLRSVFGLTRRGDPPTTTSAFADAAGAPSQK